MSMATIAAVVGIAAAGTSVGMAASGAGQPTQPNLAASSAQMAQVQAELLPLLRQLQAEEQLGGSATIPATPQQLKQAAQIQKQIDELQKQLTAAQSGTGTGADGRYPGRGITGDPARIQAKIDALEAKLGAIPKTQTVDFAGRGAADIQGQIMKALAQGQLDTAKEFDPQFIASALEQEKLADPQRFEARDMLYNDIQKQINTPVVSPVANEVQRQVAEKVAAGQNLTPEEKAMLDKAVQEGTGARGGASDGIDFSRALTTGTAGTQREMANAGAGINWLSSGQTPEDLQYRQDQQNLSNLSNYISGQTPEAQFRELSGAQQGATPMAQAQPLPTANLGAGQQGASAAVGNFGLNVSAALNQPNMWLQGLSTTLQGLNLAGRAGFQPLA
jgi:hypothetical protein